MSMSSVALAAAASPVATGQRLNAEKTARDPACTTVRALSAHGTYVAGPPPGGCRRARTGAGLAASATRAPSGPSAAGAREDRARH